MKLTSASGHCTLFLDEYHKLFVCEIFLKEEGVRKLLDITELIFSEIISRQKNHPLAPKEHTDDFYSSSSGGNTIRPFGFCFLLATFSVLNAIYNF